MARTTIWPQRRATALLPIDQNFLWITFPLTCSVAD